MSSVIRVTAIVMTAALAACASEPDLTRTPVVASTDPVPLPTRAPPKPKTVAATQPNRPAGAAASLVPTTAEPMTATAETVERPAAAASPTNPGSLLGGAPSASAQAPSSPGSLFQAAPPTATTGALPGVAAGGIGGMQLRGALPALAAPASGDALPGVEAPATRTAAAGTAPPPNERFGANPVAATTLRGAWRLRTTSSNISCTISVSPADQLAAGAVSSQKECLAYGAVNRFELRGRDLVLIDPFGETATLSQLGSFWQGRGKNGEGIILQR